MEMQPKLRSKGFIIRAQAIVVAPLLERDEQQIGNLAAEDLPGHLDAAIRWDGNGRRDGWLCQGSAQRPATQNIPGGNFGNALQLDELVFGRLRKFDAFDGGLHGGL